jgi:hypothetical protein
MIWNRMDILRAAFPSRVAAMEVARRWRMAAKDREALKGDLIRLGGVLVLQPVEAAGEPAPLDPLRLAYEAGRRDFAMQLLALMGTSIEDMNRLMEDDDA